MAIPVWGRFALPHWDIIFDQKDFLGIAVPNIMKKNSPPMVEENKDFNGCFFFFFVGF